MALESIIIITPGKHSVTVRLNQVAEDVWDTTLLYAKRLHRVGRFKGRNYAIQAATKQAAEIADAPPTAAPNKTPPAKKSSSKIEKKSEKK